MSSRHQMKLSIFDLTRGVGVWGGDRGCCECDVNGGRLLGLLTKLGRVRATPSTAAAAFQHSSVCRCVRTAAQPIRDLSTTHYVVSSSFQNIYVFANNQGELHSTESVTRPHITADILFLTQSQLLEFLSKPPHLLSYQTVFAPPLPKKHDLSMCI